MADGAGSFDKELRAQCEHYAKHYGYRSSELDRGFEGYLAHLFTQESGFSSILEGESPRTAHLEGPILRQNDLGVDVVLEDDFNKRLLIVQASWSGKNQQFPLAKAGDFFGIHFRLMEPGFVEQGSDEAQAALSNYSQKVRDGYSVEFRFVTNRTLKDNERRETMLAAAQAALDDQGSRFSCEIYGQRQLKDLNKAIEATGSGLLKKVRFPIQANDAVEFDEPRHSLICRVSGNALTNLYEQHRQALFALNIRLPMTLAQATNKEIKRTASEDPESFFFYNNGVSAVCSEFTWDQGRNEVVADRFQIINGAQTVGSIAGTPNTDKVSILFRLTETGESTGGTFTENIIRFNNTQNPVKISDFRANDPIQEFLKKELTELSGKGPIPRFVYVPKRGTKKGGRAGRQLTSEELAKIRHSFIYGPTVSFKEPKSFFDNSSEGRYWEAFGIDGNETTLWPEELLAETAIALALDDQVKATAKLLKAKVKESGRDLPEAKYLTRMSRYVVALVGVALRQQIEDGTLATFSELTTSHDRFNDVCERPLEVARRVLRLAMNQRREERDEVQPEYNLARDEPFFRHLAEQVLEELDSDL